MLDLAFSDQDYLVQWASGLCLSPLEVGIYLLYGGYHEPFVL